MPTWIVVVFGGALGTGARHAVNIAVARILHRPSPYATLTVNLVGCTVIGLLAGLLASDRMTLSPSARAFVFVGILGGFTTFSSFGLDAFTMAHGGQRTSALIYVAASVVFGLLAVAGAYAVASRA
jgi:CrcB protein